MGQDVYRAAVEQLTAELEDLLRQATKKKEAINVLYESMGEETPYKDVGSEAAGARTLRPDQYYGKPFASVAQEFLNMRKRACTSEEITKGLEQGGFDFTWKEGDRNRVVAVSLAKNTAVFHRLPNGTFGLLEWYPEAQRKKAEATKKGSRPVITPEEVVPDAEPQTDP
ncbi:MAG: hypothetical protein A2X91_09900 [Deltaproteobacteria bacterium GWB2_65_81]|nr:MAG: hypothetical protein A2X90_04015 [Deltaproteobacteria bacterium GWA2_65_63]OGP28139.1 MAG: hypothetical protein A2X91_09900 [Deltaproteobacteria bacterium GWB2_65_81]